MLTSESVDKLIPALAKATSAIGHTVAKTTQGHGYKYADLGSLLGLVSPPLEANGLILVSSQPSPDLVVTRCYHAASGQWIEVAAATSADGEQARRGGPQGAQAAGSAYTYGRRYSIMALLCIAGEDDDGAATRPARSQATPTDKGAGVRFSAEEIAFAEAKGWQHPDTWAEPDRARYRKDIDAGRVVIQ